MWASCLLQISSFTVWVLSSLSQSHFHQKWSIFIQSPVYMASSEDGLLHPLNHVTKYDEDPASADELGRQPRGLDVPHIKP